MSDYYICLDYATFMVTTDRNDIITWAAPVVKWTVGQNIGHCLRYWTDKKVLISWAKLPEGGEEIQRKEQKQKRPPL